MVKSRLAPIPRYAAVAPARATKEMPVRKGLPDRRRRSPRRQNAKAQRSAVGVGQNGGDHYTQQAAHGDHDLSHHEAPQGLREAGAPCGSSLPRRWRPQAVEIGRKVRHGCAEQAARNSPARARRHVRGNEIRKRLIGLQGGRSGVELPAQGADQHEQGPDRDGRTSESDVQCAARSDCATRYRCTTVWFRGIALQIVEESAEASTSMWAC